MNELLKLLNEFDLSEVDNNPIIRASYEEIVFQYLSDIDDFDKEDFKKFVLNNINLQPKYKEHIDIKYFCIETPHRVYNTVEKIAMIVLFKENKNITLQIKDYYIYNNKYRVCMFIKSTKINNKFTRFCEILGLSDMINQNEIDYNTYYCIISTNDLYKDLYLFK